MLKIITGRACSGKTTEIIKKVDENIKNNILNYIMVPEQLTLETEKFFINTMLKPLFLCKIMSFDRLSQEVISKVGGVKSEYIDDIYKVMLIENILLEHKDDLVLYKNSINKAGFLENVVKLFTEFKRYGISIEDIDKILKNTENLTLKIKLTEISKIYSLLEDRISDKFIDNEYRLSLLSEKIPSYVNVKKFEIFFDNFVSFTILEQNVIKNLLKEDIDITITLAYDIDDDSFEVTKKTLDNLITMCNILCKKYTIIHLDKSFKTNEEIRHIEQNFGKNNYCVYKGETNSIFTISCDNTVTEIHKLADEINNLIRNHNYKYSDIAVVVSEHEKYGKLINEIFTKYEIPFFIDSKREITGENIINLVFSFLDMYVKSPNYVNIMNFFKTGLTRISKKDYEIFENFMLNWNMDEKKYISEKVFTDDRYFVDEFENQKENIIDTFNFVNSIYKKHKKVFGKKNTCEVFSNQINIFLEELNVQEHFEILIEKLKSLGNFELVSEISQIYNILIKTIDKMNNVIDDFAVDVSMYKKMLYQGLNNQQIALIPPTIDTVMIMDIQRSKSLGYKALFMAGMNDTLLPSVKNTSILLTENEKEYMKSAGINLNNSTYDIINQEKMSVYTIISKASERIYFSYAMTDINGRGADKSSYIINLEYIFPRIKKIYISKNDIKNLENISFKVAFENMRQDIREMLDNKEFDDEIIKKYKYFTQIKNFDEDIKILNKSIFMKNEIINIDKEYIEKIYKKPIKSSISKIEKYIKCPFSYYINYGINPQVRKNEKLDNLKSGNIMHKYMEEFSKEILQNDTILSLDTKEKIDDFVEKIYSKEDFFEKNVKLVTDSSKRQMNIVNKLKKISKKATNIIIEQKKSSSFKTVYSEKEIKYDLDDISFSGKIDRVDEVEKDGKEYVQIIDYKSSVKSISFEDIYNGLNIQMLFYLYVLSQEDKNPYGVLYFPMLDKKVEINDDIEDLEEKLRETMKMNGIFLDDLSLLKAFENDIDSYSKYTNASIKKDKVSEECSVTNDEMKKLLKKVVDIIRENTHKMLDGDIIPSPMGDSTCVYCDYKNICKFDESIEGFEKKKIEKLRPRAKKQDFFEKIEEKREV